MRSPILTLLPLAVLLAAPAVAEIDFVDTGRAAWARRAESSSGTMAAAEPIGEAIAAFEQALAQEPGNLAIRAWLLKALWFRGEHVSSSPDERLAVFERGRDLAQETIDQLAAAAGTEGRPISDPLIEHLRTVDHAADIYFWGAAHWGLWGRYRGKIASARQGVAGKIRDYAEITIALDDELEDAGGHRILGRLHTEAPKLPFVTGWIDREEAVRQLEIAVEIAPADLMNQLYLLEALIEFVPSRKAQAVEQLRTLVATEPNPDTLVEDEKLLEDARELLRRAQ